MSVPDLVDNVKAFVKNPSGPTDDVISSLLSADRNDIIAQSAIRYMMRLGVWRFEQNGGFHEAMNHLFADYPERKSLDPESYQAKTKEIIQKEWGYECIPIAKEPVSEIQKQKKSNTPRKKSKVETVPDEEGVSGSKIYKSINQQNGIDTTGASERLQKVIDIQRNG